MDRVGPFCPDCTTVLAKRGGRIIGIERGRGCDGIVALLPVIGAQPERAVMVDGVTFEVPVAFFKGQGLSILFRTADGSEPSCDAEAYLLVEYAPPAAA